MRKLQREEMVKRGCIYCLDMRQKKFGKIYQFYCTYRECPYHDLDAFDTYRQYIKSKGPIKFPKLNDEK